MSESQNDQFYEIVPPKYCPIVGGYCQEHCAWDIGGECAVVSIAGSLNALPLDEVTEAVNHVAAELKRKVY